MPVPPAPARRIVILAPALPRSLARDAGTRYITLLTDALAEQADVTVLGPDFTGNHEAVADAPHGQHLEVVGLRRGDALARRVHLALARVDPSLPYLPFTLGLLRPDVRRRLAAADVVDLQYAEMARLAGLVRRINPRARILATHHDVLSQRFARTAASATRWRARTRWRLAARLARRAERGSARRVDVSLAFSAKDAALVPGTVVLDPPMALPAAEGPPLADRPPVVVFVGFLARPENDDAARWLVTDIWPAVVRSVPDARLRLVGAGTGPALTATASADPSVEVTGFVDDLATEYAGARACVVPLRHGAGVKFKVIEALAAGTPLVLTHLGAEGVAGPERFVRLSDDADHLAAGLVTALTAPDDAHATAQRTWARERYGPNRFRTAVHRHYALGNGS